MPKFNEIIEFENSLLILNVFCIVLPVLYICFELACTRSGRLAHGRARSSSGKTRVAAERTPLLGPISKRYVKKRHFFMFGLFLASSLITPPDIISTFLFAVPLIAFMELAVLVQQIAITAARTMGPAERREARSCVSA